MYVFTCVGICVCVSQVKVCVGIFVALFFIVLCTRQLLVICAVVKCRFMHYSGPKLYKSNCIMCQNRHVFNKTKFFFSLVLTFTVRDV